MSHFTVAIINDPNGKTVDELLAPFHEFECTGTVDEYVQSINQTEEARGEYETYKLTKYRATDGSLYDAHNDMFYREPTEEESKNALGGSLVGSGCGNGISWASKDWNDGKGYRTKVHYLPEGYEQIEVFAKEVMSFRDFIQYYYERPMILENDIPDLQDEHKFGWVRVNKNGDVIELVDRTNPNYKWDWYQIGGRYSGLLTLKVGSSGSLGTKSWCNKDQVIKSNQVDCARLSDIDFSPDQNEYEKAIRFWELYVDGQETQNKEDEDLIKYHFYRPEYYLNRYLTKENYAKAQSEFSTYAVITPDGEWHSKGDMGWWACSSETDEEDRTWRKDFFDTFIKNTNPEFNLTIVDCHI